MVVRGSLKSPLRVRSGSVRSTLYAKKMNGNVFRLKAGLIAKVPIFFKI